MKKWTILLLSALLLLSSVACGSKSAAAPVDLQKICDEAIASLDGTEAVFFPSTSEEEIYGVYPELKDIECKQLVAYFHPVLGAPCEVVMVEVADSADVSAAQAAMQSRIDAVTSDTFYADNAEGWKNSAQVYVTGNYVVMSVLPAGVEKPAAFKAEF